MNDQTVSAFLLLWGVLLTAPIVSFLLTRSFMKKGNLAALKRARYAGLLYLALFIAFLFLGINSSTPLFNILFLCVLYVSYNFLYFQHRLLSKIWMKWGLGIIFSVPILAAYFLATIGVLALLFLVGDVVSSPVRSEPMADNLVCERTFWGMAASDSGYTDTLYWRSKYFPFIQKNVGQSRVNETECAKNGCVTPVAGCKELFVLYRDK